jgi:hypothetical protein
MKCSLVKLNPVSTFLGKGQRVIIRTLGSLSIIAVRKLVASCINLFLLQLIMIVVKYLYQENIR